MRYAIYFVPRPETPLAGFGSAILGYDCETGHELPHPPLPDVSREQQREWTADPRRYGFHATLKAPFRLRDGVREDDVIAVAQAFAATHRAFQVASLAVRRLDGCIALVPAQQDTRLDQLAGDAVRAFDHLRAPMEAADRQRRLAGGLTPRQTGHLDRWGYPYVFEDFRFHMTLTGRLRDGDIHRAMAALTLSYADVAGPVAIDAVTISRQAGAGARFRTLQRIAFLT